MVRPAHLLVSGTYRSGTTFVERLIDNLSDGFCAAQPFPYLYLSAKRRFLSEQGVRIPQYPIGTGFHDPVHLPNEMAASLGSAVFDPAVIAETFRSMQGYSGAQTPELAEVVEHIGGGTLGEVVRSMHTLLAERHRASARVLASKEVLLEEFIPTCAEAGIRVLLVVRDPRAVVASTFGPAANAWTGTPRPLLYTIRLWRKSVAYALKFEDTVACVRLEDLAEDPARTLRDRLRTLDIETDGAVADPLLDARGRAWAHNTSYPDSTHTGLSDRQLAYVEALTGPEMLALGYAPAYEADPDGDALERFRAVDDPGREHPAFDTDYSIDPAQLSLERARLAHLRSRESLPDEASWFVLPDVRDRLAATAERESSMMPIIPYRRGPLA